MGSDVAFSMWSIVHVPFVILVSRGNGVTADFIRRYQTKLPLQSEITSLTTNSGWLRAIWTTRSDLAARPAI